MTSEITKMYRVTDDKTEVIEQYPVTITNAVYDSVNEQFLNETIVDINQQMNQIESQIGDSQGIPPVFSENISEVALKLARIDDGYDFKFAYITDTHYIDNNYPTLANKNYLHARNVVELSYLHDLDLAVHGGDLNYDYLPFNKFLENLTLVARDFRKAKCPVMIVQGNHDTGDKHAFDTGISVEKVISPKEWGKLMSIDNDKRVYGDESRSYYYKDFESKKIRVIVLNTHDAWVLDSNGKPKYNRSENSSGYPATYAIKQQQLTWFANTALNFTGKDGYGVIVISHAGLIHEIDDYKRTINDDIAFNILKARKNKTSYTSTTTTGDFGQSISVNYSTANNVDIICCINGHTHKDATVIKDDIRFISTTSSRHPSDNKISDSDAWDVFCINTTSKRVKIKRFGNRGVDREFSYGASISPIMSLSAQDFTNNPKTTTLTDRSGNNNNGNVVNFEHTLTSGSDGNGGIVFDGTNDYLEIANNSMINPSNEMTLEVKLKLDLSKTGRQILVSKVLAGSYYLYHNQTDLNDNKLRFGVRIDSNYYSVGADVPTISNQIYHIICKYDGEEVSMFINGVKQNNVTTVSGTITPNTMPLRIGSAPDGVVDTMKGTLYFVKLYNKALSDSDIINSFSAI